MLPFFLAPAVIGKRFIFLPAGCDVGFGLPGGRRRAKRVLRKKTRLDGYDCIAKAMPKADGCFSCGKGGGNVFSGSEQGGGCLRPPGAGVLI